MVRNFVAPKKYYYILNTSIWWWVVDKMPEYINGHCVNCQCYWGTSDKKCKSRGCGCECHS